MNITKKVLILGSFTELLPNEEALRFIDAMMAIMKLPGIVLVNTYGQHIGHYINTAVTKILMETEHPPVSSLCIAYHPISKEHCIGMDYETAREENIKSLLHESPHLVIAIGGNEGTRTAAELFTQNKVPVFGFPVYRGAGEEIFNAMPVAIETLFPKTVNTHGKRFTSLISNIRSGSDRQISQLKHVIEMCLEESIS